MLSGASSLLKYSTYNWLVICLIVIASVATSFFFLISFLLFSLLLFFLYFFCRPLFSNFFLLFASFSSLLLLLLLFFVFLQYCINLIFCTKLVPLKGQRILPSISLRFSVCFFVFYFVPNKKSFDFGSQCDKLYLLSYSISIGRDTKFTFK